ncbi:MAG TPA: hypothetical protein VGS08_05415 [Candidatus Saccharimonadales bacterium]|nr:hypothetical protein [Candidatus Saccharimonadales bacterium]
MIKKPEPLICAAYDALTTIVKRAGSGKQTFLDDPILQDATMMRLVEASEYLARVRGSYFDL